MSHLSYISVFISHSVSQIDKWYALLSYIIIKLKHKFQTARVMSTSTADHEVVQSIELGVARLGEFPLTFLVLLMLCNK